ncbi:ATP-binding protein, partial [Limosilactobacillus mucosae]
MKRYSNYELLIIDEIGYLPMKPDDANLLFQLVNNWYEQHSTITTTNVPLSGWGEFWECKIFCVNFQIKL